MNLAHQLVWYAATPWAPPRTKRAGVHSRQDILIQLQEQRCKLAPVHAGFA
jgi:hypothetical protein